MGNRRGRGEGRFEFALSRRIVDCQRMHVLAIELQWLGRMLQGGFSRHDGGVGWLTAHRHRVCRSRNFEKKRGL